MSFAVTVSVPFPNLLWWTAVAEAGSVLFDEAAHFEKMSYRNRYYVAGANGLITLSIPLVHGRNQRVAMNEVRICNKDRWQTQHWRTIMSAYNRSPFFQHYEPALKPLFEQEFDLLQDFNMATMHWLKTQLRQTFDETFTNDFRKDYPDAMSDLRKNMKPGLEQSSSHRFPEYYQVFSDRTGFLPNLSMLDLLFAEGPHAMAWIRERKDALLQLLA
ncbi:WbqC family protein [Chitinophagaceae bacterium MMS25-I14]